jgi:hypothetical protein
MEKFFLDILNWLGASPARMVMLITLVLVFGASWFAYTEKDAFMASYRAQQALPHMNGKYDEAIQFIFKNTDAEMVAVFEVNQLLNTRKIVYFTSRDGRIKEHDGRDVGLLTKNYDNNNDVIGLMSGKIPCSPYLKPQSFIGFVYRDLGVNFMCRISVPAEPGTFIGQLSVGFKEEPKDVERAQTVMTIASGILFKTK